MTHCAHCKLRLFTLEPQVIELAELHQRARPLAELFNRVRPKTDVINKIAERLAAGKFGQRLHKDSLRPEACIDHAEGKTLIAPNFGRVLIVPRNQERKEVTAVLGKLELLKVSAQIECAIVLIPSQAIKALRDVGHGVWHEDRVRIQGTGVQTESQGLFGGMARHVYCVHRAWLPFAPLNNPRRSLFLNLAPHLRHN